ncbi:hypothetical protein [uncultured Deinococcus sp.]|uniref:hypothetical protein n=1 Tax=uncultured Deinococcus sp. TaxID=158789 RepID=UPI002582C4BE|nr:hypothetical protein [uncultured Deinococcus sp.]
MPFTQDVQATIRAALPEIGARLLRTPEQDLPDPLDHLEVRWVVKETGVVVVTVRPRFGSAAISGRNWLNTAYFELRPKVVDCRLVFERTLPEFSTSA